MRKYATHTRLLSLLVFHLSAAGIDPCDSEPCLNEGICESQGEGYMCRCLGGYTGDNCEERKYCKTRNMGAPLIW